MLLLGQTGSKFRCHVKLRAGASPGHSKLGELKSPSNRPSLWGTSSTCMALGGLPAAGCLLKIHGACARPGAAASAAKPRLGGDAKADTALLSKGARKLERSWFSIVAYRVSANRSRFLAC